MQAMQGVEGFLYDDEADLLLAATVRMLSMPGTPRAVIEIESYCGKSTVIERGPEGKYVGMARRWYGSTGVSSGAGPNFGWRIAGRSSARVGTAPATSIDVKRSPARNPRGGPWSAREHERFRAECRSKCDGRLTVSSLIVPGNGSAIDIGHVRHPLVGRDCLLSCDPLRMMTGCIEAPPQCRRTGRTLGALPEVRRACKGAVCGGLRRCGRPWPSLGGASRGSSTPNGQWQVSSPESVKLWPSTGTKLHS